MKSIHKWFIYRLTVIIIILSLLLIIGCDFERIERQPKGETCDEYEKGIDYYKDRYFRCCEDCESFEYEYLEYIPSMAGGIGRASIPPSCHCKNGNISVTIY